MCHEGKDDIDSELGWQEGTIRGLLIDHTAENLKG
jgi:hypothetical protein